MVLIRKLRARSHLLQYVISGARYDIEKVLSEAYRKEDAGRSSRKPIGIFKALIVKAIFLLKAN